ncbi:MAG TPA: hypothetical protein DCS82_08100 [Rhodospirillaceae bacterium]|nr:hypothetical protein [Rhodospirillaceae bacterium]HAT35663.1 hypothetical protein [Rhodospirillaceae bacterium]
MALESQGIPTVTLISCSFCTLAQAVSSQLDYPGLPIHLLPHPLGHSDLDVVKNRGREAASEVVRILTTPNEVLAAEFTDKEFPLPEHAVGR